MKDKLTTAWAYAVAAMIYGIFVFTAFAYFGEIVLWLQVIYGIFVFTAFAYFGEIVLWLQEVVYG